MSNEKILTSFLLPADTVETMKGPTELMSSICRTQGERVKEIILLHAMVGGYLSKHMANVDIRAAEVLSSDQFKRIRKEHILKNLEPKLQQIKEMIDTAESKAVVNTVIEEGKPAQVIARVAKETNISTIIMERRHLSRMEEVLLGCVTDALLHTDLRTSFYFTGSAARSRDCREANCLVALDDSVHSKAALEEAMVYLGPCGKLKNVILMTVVEMADYGDRIENGDDPVKAASKLMDESADWLISAGVSQEKIVKIIKPASNAAEVIKEEIEEYSVDTIFLGRRGVSALSEIFLGSVSRNILTHCHDQTVVLVSAD